MVGVATKRILELEQRLAVVTAEREVGRDRIAGLEAEAETLRNQLREVVKAFELQKADLERYKAMIESMKPNRREHAPSNDLQLAFDRALVDLAGHPAANEVSKMPKPGAEAADSTPASPDAEAKEGTPVGATKGGDGKPHPHGRRRLDRTNLPVEIVMIDPDEVTATGGAGFIKIGDETAERLAFRRGGYIRVRFVRTKWVREGDSSTISSASADEESIAPRSGVVLVAPLPNNVWPRVMADASAIAHSIVAKYDDGLPLNRQEKITTRDGFRISKATLCGWFGEAYDVTCRIVDAMFAESKREAFWIATDATGAPVLARGACKSWHVFVFIAERDHIVFRYTRKNTSDAIETMLDGFHGNLIADAAPIYDVLYRDHGVHEVDCWFHARRYFFRALETDRERALEALGIISKLFDVQRSCLSIAMPERTETRARLATPLLDLLDAWIERHRGKADPRGPLDQAIRYYTNQREGLRRFLVDGRLRLDNSISEQQLRNVVLGRHNWKFFANETGLRWYSTFRSLIASCALHGLNPEDYLEQVLRLAPHWPIHRMLELSPKYWAQTVAGLQEPLRSILARPWEISRRTVDEDLAPAA